MAPDDFDKIDEDDDFASEFDFVEEDSKSTTAGGSTPPAQQQPSGGGKPPSAMLKIVLMVITVAGLGFFGYSQFMGGKPEDTAATPTPDAATQQAATANDQIAPLPEPSPPDMAQQTPNALQPSDQDSVDFSQAFNQAQTQTTPVTTTTTTTTNGGAVPTKTFEQVQRELQGNKQAPAPTQMVIPESINATLDSLSEEMTMNVNQIKQLETTIANLATTVEQLNRTVTAMDNRVLSLTEIADNLAHDLNNVKKVMVAEDLDLTNPGSLKYTPKKQAQPITNNATTYTVHAIIPGRAWLKSSNGQIVTVTEGDKVGDFGTIAVIDATNGVVRTSSGITFR